MFEVLAGLEGILDRESLDFGGSANARLPVGEEGRRGLRAQGAQSVRVR